MINTYGAEKILGMDNNTNNNEEGTMDITKTLEEFATLQENVNVCKSAIDAYEIDGDDKDNEYMEYIDANFDEVYIADRTWTAYEVLENMIDSYTMSEQRQEWANDFYDDFTEFEDYNELVDELEVAEKELKDYDLLEIINILQSKLKNEQMKNELLATENKKFSGLVTAIAGVNSTITE